MTTQVSFSKYEQELRPALREKINSAESTEDVRKFFVYTVQELFKKAVEGNLDLEDEDIHLDPKGYNGFAISQRLKGIRDFASVWNNSDLPHIVRRMAEFAIKRHKRLLQHTDKTEAKMYPVPGKRGG